MLKLIPSNLDVIIKEWLLKLVYHKKNCPTKKTENSCIHSLTFPKRGKQHKEDIFRIKLHDNMLKERIRTKL